MHRITAEKPKQKRHIRRKAREWGVVYVQGRTEAPTAETNSAMGHITDQTTGKPLRKVRVRMAGLNKRIKSNANGRYALPLLTEGEHVVEFLLKGYATVKHTITVQEGEMVQVDVQMQEKENGAGHR